MYDLNLQKVLLYFTRFDVEASGGVCGFDFVSISYGMQQTDLYCGRALGCLGNFPHHSIVTPAPVIVQFSSDFSMAYTGFELHYRLVGEWVVH